MPEFAGFSAELCDRNAVPMVAASAPDFGYLCSATDCWFGKSVSFSVIQFPFCKLHFPTSLRSCENQERLYGNRSHEIPKVESLYTQFI